MRYKPKPAAATLAPEPPALEEPAPEEPTPEEDTTLPDLPPPEPQQPEARASGEEQVKATDATPADGTSVGPPTTSCLDHRHYVLNAS
jgi:hypothetical protein